MESLFCINNLRFHYPKRNSDNTLALDFSNNLPLVIPRGKKTFILGPSGCGKTTLLQILGLLRDADLTDSSISMNLGDDVKHDYKKLTKVVKNSLRSKQFGFILQSFPLLPNFNGFDNISMPLILQGEDHKKAHQKTKDLTAKSDLFDASDKELVKRLSATSDMLSQGEKQRVAILRSLIHNPSVLFADEFTSSLDVETTDKSFELLNNWLSEGLNLNNQRSIIMVSHDIQTALKQGDYFIVLDKQHKLALSFLREEYQFHEKKFLEILPKVSNML